MAESGNDLSGLYRLSTEQNKALEDTKSSKEQYQKYRSDYEKLRKKLKTLPDKLTHDVLVPFGPLAFMPGKLVHTNEILVLLGDDWFAERSAKQACEIVDRRIKAIDEQITNLDAQWKLLDSRKEFTEEFLEASGGEGMFEIKEDYDEAKEKEWREKHKISLAKQRLLESCESDTHRGDELDEDLMRRFDELERLELEESDNDDETSEQFDKTQYRQPQGEHNTETDEDDSDDSDSDTNDSPPTTRITFSHTPGPPKSLSIAAQDISACSDTATIQSPADIYKLFQHQSIPDEPKSILKKSKSLDSGIHEHSKQSHPHVHFQDIEKEETHIPVIKQDIPEHFEPSLAFSGVIKEHDTKLDHGRTEPPKRVSKFKQQRMQQAKR